MFEAEASVTGENITLSFRSLRLTIFGIIISTAIKVRQFDTNHERPKTCILETLFKLICLPV